MIERSEITGIVLCGGRGARLNGSDKPLLSLGQMRIIDVIIDRLQPQIHQLVISCSRNVALYEALGHEVVVDQEPERGPLAGIFEAFEVVSTEWALTVPGDVPFVPVTLIERLSKDAIEQGIAVPSTHGHRQNLCLLINANRRKELMDYYLQGGKAVKFWLDDCGVAATDLTDLNDDFLNVNEKVDLDAAVQRVKEIHG